MKKCVLLILSLLPSFAQANFPLDDPAIDSIIDIADITRFFTRKKLKHVKRTALPHELGQLTYEQARLDAAAAETFEGCDGCTPKRVHPAFTNLSVVSAEGMAKARTVLGSASYWDWVGAQKENKCYSALQNPMSFLKTQVGLAPDLPLNLSVTKIQEHLSEKCGLSLKRSTALIPQIILYKMLSDPLNWRKAFDEIKGKVNIAFQKFIIDEMAVTLRSRLAPFSAPKSRKKDTVLNILRGGKDQNSALFALQILETINSKKWKLAATKDESSFTLYQADGTSYMVYGAQRMPSPFYTFDSEGRPSSPLPASIVRSIGTTLQKNAERKAPAQILMTTDRGAVVPVYAGVATDSNDEPVSFAVSLAEDVRGVLADVGESFRERVNFLNETYTFESAPNTRLQTYFRGKGLGVRTGLKVVYAEDGLNLNAGVEGRLAAKGLTPDARAKVYVGASKKFNGVLGEDSYVLLRSGANAQINLDGDISTQGYVEGHAEKKYFTENCEFLLGAGAHYSLYNFDTTRVDAYGGAGGECEIFKGTTGAVNYIAEYEDGDLKHTATLGIKQGLNDKWNIETEGRYTRTGKDNTYEGVLYVNYEDPERATRAFAGIGGELNKYEERLYVTAGGQTKVPYIDATVSAGASIYSDLSTSAALGIEKKFEIDDGTFINVATGAFIPLTGSPDSHFNNRYASDYFPTAVYDEIYPTSSRDNVTLFTRKFKRRTERDTKPLIYASIEPTIGNKDNCLDVYLFDVCGKGVVTYDGSDLTTGIQGEIKF